MNWAQFYLICFLVGFVFSVLSFVMGGLRWHVPFHIHLPHFDGGHLHHGGAHGNGHQASGHSVFSPFNPATIAAFLVWFGGAGYLLTRYSGFWVVTGLGVSAVIGLVGASVVFLFLTRVLTSQDESLDPADFEMVGVLGRTSVPIRAGGTGEIIYSQAGTRRVCGARADLGGEIAKGAEVVVTRYEKGLAYVRLWSELAGEPDEREPEQKSS